MTIRIIAVSARIAHADLEPDVVSRLLDISPTESHRAREPNVIRATGATAGEFTAGQWTFQVQIAGGDVEQHVNALLDSLAPNLNTLETALPNGYRKDILIGVFIPDGTGGFALGAECLRRLWSLGFTVDVDIYTS